MRAELWQLPTMVPGELDWPSRGIRQSDMPCTIAVPEEGDVRSNVGHAQAAKRDFVKQPKQVDLAPLLTEGITRFPPLERVYDE